MGSQQKQHCRYTSKSVISESGSPEDLLPFHFLSAFSHTFNLINADDIVIKRCWNHFTTLFTNSFSASLRSFLLSALVYYGDTYTYSNPEALPKLAAVNDSPGVHSFCLLLGSLKLRTQSLKFRSVINNKEWQQINRESNSDTYLRTLTRRSGYKDLLLTNEGITKQRETQGSFTLLHQVIYNTTRLGSFFQAFFLLLPSSDPLMGPSQFSSVSVSSSLSDNFLMVGRYRVARSPGVSIYEHFFK